MSTPRRLKEARMEAHRQEKIEKERKKLFTVNSNKKEFIPYVPKPIYRKEEQKYESAVSSKLEHSAAATAKPRRTAEP